jgi:hypothetical protein
MNGDSIEPSAATKQKSFTGVFGSSLVELAEKDDRIIAITSAMCDGTGLGEFRKKFPDRFFDFPDAFKTFRENYHVAGAKGNRVAGGAVGYGYFSFYNQAGFCLGVVPVEGAGEALPDRPVFAGFGLLVGWFFDDNIFYSRHLEFSILLVLEAWIIQFDSVKS